MEKSTLFLQKAFYYLLLTAGVGAIITLGCIIYTRFTPPFPLSVTSLVTNKNDVFSVTAEVKETAVPDMAEISLGIEKSGPKIAPLQEEVNKIINKITNELKSLGVEEKNIKTTRYSVYPNYDYSAGAQKITGYSVSSSIRVRAKKLEVVNDVIDKSISSGANEVSGLTFILADETREKLIEKAREEAVVKAKEKAEKLASAAGIRLGRVINIFESAGSDFEPRPVFAAMEAKGGGGTPTNVSPGEAEISLTVTLQYETR